MRQSVDAGGEAVGVGATHRWSVRSPRPLRGARQHFRVCCSPTTIGDFSPAGNYLEEGTILAAQRIVLREIGFSGEALEWHAPKEHGLPIDRKAARKAAAWLLR
jgi:hypothetical protein